MPNTRRQSKNSRANSNSKESHQKYLDGETIYNGVDDTDLYESSGDEEQGAGINLKKRKRENDSPVKIELESGSFNEDFEKAQAAGTCTKKIKRDVESVIQNGAKKEEKKTKAKPQRRRPAKCPKCAAILDRGHIKDHLKLHEGDEKDKVICKYCNGNFYNERVLKFHMSKYHGEKPGFKCRYCDHHVKAKCYIASHERTHPESAEFGLKKNIPKIINYERVPARKYIPLRDFSRSGFF